MESFVEHPGAAQVLPPRDVGDGWGSFWGRLPFMPASGRFGDEVGALLLISIRAGEAKGFVVPGRKV